MLPPILVSSEDRARLLELVSHAEGPVAEQLEHELDRAEVLPLQDVPSDVIVMDSEVEYEELGTGRRRQLRLVFPREADGAAGLVQSIAARLRASRQPSSTHPNRPANSLPPSPTRPNRPANSLPPSPTHPNGTIPSHPPS
ncbi:MAG: hypothetical protein H6722_15920 [Sandaracinus sp.]|nr:hypothetical protein [Sandaracinus sp.]